MTQDVAEKLLALERLGPQLEDLLRQSDDPARRALGLAQMLRSLWPSSPLAMCTLTGDEPPVVAVTDATGKPNPHWADLLLREGDAGGQLPPALNLQKWTLVRQKLGSTNGGQGSLGLALPENAAEQSAGRALLAVAAQQVGLRLALETQGGKLRSQQHEIERQTSLANVGELARPVAHEFNNFLNVLLVNMAVLEMELPEKFRQQLAEIQRQGKAITAVVRRFQHYRQEHQTPVGVVDLNTVVGAEAAALAAGASVELKLAPDLPQVAGNIGDFRRLCHFLLANALAVVPARHGKITLQTETVPGKVLLRLEDNGPPLSSEQLDHFFDLNLAVREGTCPLELAACKSLVRRLHGSILAENRPEGGLRLVLEFPAITP